MYYKKSILLFLTAIFLCNANVFCQNKIDENGLKQGSWIKHDEKGKVVYKGTFKDDYPVDTFYYFAKNGGINLVNVFSNKGKENYSTFLYPNGKTKAEGKYIDKKKEGTWKYYNIKGKKIAEENYKDNLKNGICKNWDDDGKTILKSTTYKNGVRQGEYRQNLLSVGYYKANYDNDVLDGEYREYDNSNKLKIKGQYKKGNKEGVWEVYNYAGEIVQKLFYEKDIFTRDLIRFNVQNGYREISQNDIALARSMGKQSQLILFTGEKVAVINSLDFVVEFMDASQFVRLNEKTGIYINIDALRSFENGKLTTTIDFGFELNPDKDGLQMLNSLFRKD